MCAFIYKERCHVPRKGLQILCHIFTYIAFFKIKWTFYIYVLSISFSFFMQHYFFYARTWRTTLPFCISRVFYLLTFIRDKLYMKRISVALWQVIIAIFCVQALYVCIYNLLDNELNRSNTCYVPIFVYIIHVTVSI